MEYLFVRISLVDSLCKSCNGLKFTVLPPPNRICRFLGFQLDKIVQATDGKLVFLKWEVVPYLVHTSIRQPGEPAYFMVGQVTAKGVDQYVPRIYALFPVGVEQSGLIYSRFAYYLFFYFIVKIQRSHPAY